MNIKDEQTEIVEEFALFTDWQERYQYLIDLGRQLPPLESSECVEENRLHGCQSQVWLLDEGDAHEVRFRAYSDSAIVAGLIALMLRVYSNRPARDIVETAPDFVKEIGLQEHLSPTRSNGLAAFLAALKERAAKRIGA